MHKYRFDLRDRGQRTVGIVRLSPGVDGVDISVGVDEHGEGGEHFLSKES